MARNGLCSEAAFKHYDHQWGKIGTHRSYKMPFMNKVTKGQNQKH